MSFLCSCARNQFLWRISETRNKSDSLSRKLDSNVLGRRRIGAAVWIGELSCIWNSLIGYKLNDLTSSCAEQLVALVEIIASPITPGAVLKVVFIFNVLNSFGNTSSSNDTACLPRRFSIQKDSAPNISNIVSLEENYYSFYKYVIKKRHAVPKMRQISEEGTFPIC